MIAKRKGSKTPSKYAQVKGVEYRGDAEICMSNVDGLYEYRKRLHTMISRQLNKCGLCRKPSNSLTFDHQDGRGMGGSHRDDRIWNEDGTPRNAALCLTCQGIKGSRRFIWRNNIYGPI